LSPSGSRDAITPHRVARVLWRRKLVCLVVAILVFAGGAGLLLTRPNVYQSTSSVALLPATANASVLPNYPNLIASLIPTYVQLVSSPVLLDRVAATLPFHISGAQLAKEVHAEALSNAAVINIVAENGNAIRAEEIASRTTAVFLADVQGNGVVTTQIYGLPRVPSKPSVPRTKLVLGVILAFAVILGLAAGLAWDRLLRRGDGTGQADETTDPPVLGMVPEWSAQQGIAGVLAGHGTTAALRSWRSLRTNFMYARAEHPMHSVTVTSLGPGEGKTAVAVNLAAALAETGLAVVLVDAAVRRPTLHKVLSMDNGQGLTSTLLNGADPASLLRSVPHIAGLQVITAGPPLPAPQDEARLYLKQLPKFTSLADLVIVSSPPLQGDGDAALVASVTDGVLLVVGSGVSRPEQAAVALRILKRNRAPVLLLGTVLTGTDRTTNHDEPSGDSGTDSTSEAADPAARA
jgi:tyrosine-protein kinase